MSGAWRLEPVAPDPDDLLGRLALPRRLALRVTALAARGVGVTETLALVAAEEANVAQCLLGRTLLDAAPEPEALRAALGDAPVELTEDSLGAPLLCLDEELLASRAPQPALPETTLSTALAGPATSPTLASHEVPALQERFLSAPATADRTAALRDLLVRAPLADDDRGRILLRALADADAQIQRTATGLLEAAGLPRALADALRDLEHPDATLRRHAIGRLRKALDEAREPPEERWLAATLLLVRRALPQESVPALEAGLALLLAECCRGAVASETNVQEVVRTLVKTSLGVGGEVRVAADRALGVLGATAPETTDRALGLELAATSDPALGLSLAAARCELASPADAAKRVNDLLERTVHLADPPVHLLARCLRPMAAIAVPRTLELLPTAPVEAQPALVELVDRLPHESPDDARRALLPLLETAGPVVARAILESRLMRAPAAPAEARALASELVARLSLFYLPDLWETCLHEFAALGRHALPALSRALTSPGADRQLLLHALELLAATLQSPAVDAAHGVSERDEVFDLLVELLESDPALAPQIADVVGSLLACPSAPVSEVIGRLRSIEARHETTPHHDELVPDAPLTQTLARVAERPDLPAELQDELEQKLLAVLTAPEPSGDLLLPLPEEERPWTGRVYAAADGDLRYTVALPAAIEGMRALALGAADGRILRRRTLHLLAAWERLAPGLALESDAPDLEPLEWGPANLALLVREICAIAGSDRATPGVRKLLLTRFATSDNLLFPDEHDLPVVRAAASALSRAELAAQREHGHRILSLVVHARREGAAFEAAERAILLEAMARIACLPALTAPEGGPPRQSIERLIHHVTEQVRTALRAGSDVGASAATILLDCPHLEEGDREELLERLRRRQLPTRSSRTPSPASPPRG